MTSKVVEISASVEDDDGIFKAEPEREVREMAEWIWNYGLGVVLSQQSEAEEQSNRKR